MVLRGEGWRQVVQTYGWAAGVSGKGNCCLVFKVVHVSPECCVGAYLAWYPYSVPYRLIWAVGRGLCWRSVGRLLLQACSLQSV